LMVSSKAARAMEKIMGAFDKRPFPGRGISPLLSDARYRFTPIDFPEDDSPFRDSGALSLTIPPGRKLLLDEAGEKSRMIFNAAIDVKKYKKMK